MNNFYRRSFWAFLSLTLIIGNVAIAFAAPNLSITALHLANMQRISRFEYEMNYRATVTNTGTQANAVTANLVVNNPATTVMGANQLSFGNVAANSSKQSTNTIKIQHDRRTKLQPEHFVWTVNSANQPPVNQAPQVNAGANQTITLPAVANLTGTVTDDGLPNPPAAVTQSWAKVSGPGAVTFGNANARTTTATFAVAGTYVLKLTASDSVLSASDEVQIAVDSQVDLPQARIEFVTDQSLMFSNPGQFRTVTVRVLDENGVVVPNAQVTWVSTTPASVAVAATGPLSAKVTAQANWSSGTVPINVAYAALDLTAKAFATIATPAPETVLLSSDAVLAITGDRFAEHQVTLARTPETEVLQVGDIIVTGDKAGVMVRILQVTVQANQVVLRVEPVAINVAFRDLNLTTNGESIEATLQVTRHGSFVNLRSKSGQLLTTKSLRNSEWECIGTLTPVQLGVSLFNVTQQLIPRAGLRIENYQIVDFLLMVEGGSSIDTRIKLSLTGQLSGKCSRKLTEISFPEFPLTVFSLGISYPIEVGVELSGNAQGSLTFPGVKAGWWVKGGVRYTSDRGWEPIADKRIDAPNMSGSMGVESSVAVQANLAPFGSIAAESKFKLGRSFLSIDLVKVKFLELKAKVPYLNFAIPLPLDPIQSAYKGPSMETGIAADASAILEATLFEGTLAKYLPFDVKTSFKFSIFSYSSVLSNLVKPSGSVACTPNCNSLPTDGSGQVTLKALADTVDTGKIEFWASKDGASQLTKLNETSFANGQGQTIFRTTNEIGTYKVYPRLKIDDIIFSSFNNRFPLAAERGASIGEFTVGQTLTLSPPSVSLSGTGGQSGSNSNALQVSNSQDAAANYTLQWNPLNPNVFLSPVSGTVQSQGSTPITATYSCPIQGGDWNGKIELHNSDGTVEDAADVSLSCTCETPECECPNPPCCANPPCKDGESNGDPHLTTFDGLAYDFQAVGEFIFAKSLLPNDTFEVQVRTKPWENRTDVAITQSAAMKVANDRVSFYNKINPLTHINGVPKALAEGETVTLPSGGSVNRSGDLYSVLWPDGSYVKVIDNNWGFLVKTTITQDKQGKLTGLMGNADNNRENDVIIKNGANLGTQFAFTDLYPVYADSWRITQQESLFDYAPGETTETFTDRNFPRVEADADDLTDADRAAAEQICRAAGITDPILLENCILDVALTGEPAFAQTGLQVPAGTVTVTPPPPPTINDPGFGQFKGSVTNAVTNLFMNTGSVDLTVDGTPLTGVTTKPITNGIYETDVVPIGNGYRLDIQANGYINEKIFALTAVDRQLVQVEPVKLVPSTANGTGTVTGHIANALNNNNVANVNILARRYINQRGGNPIVNAVTNTDGNFTLNGLTAGNYTLEVNGTGFIANYLTAVVIGNQTTNVTATISPELGASQFRIVLTWGENPSDLDSHLTGPNGNGGRFHVYYGNRGNSNLEIAPYTYLDRDDQSGFGPETITIGQLISGDVYRYSVKKYSGSSTLALSGAKVEIYGNNNRLLTTLNVPNQEGTLWTVFEINTAGVIVPVNQITNGTNPYSAPAGQRTGNQQGDLVTDYWQMLFHKKD